MTAENANTRTNLMSAAGFVEHVSRSHSKNEVRVRAASLLAMIRVLDTHIPDWRDRYLAALDDAGVARDPTLLLPLPILDPVRIFEEYVKYSIAYVPPPPPTPVKRQPRVLRKASNHMPQFRDSQYKSTDEV